MATKCRNFLATLVQVSGGAANAEVTVAHGLKDPQGNGIIPRGALVIRRFSNAILYKGTTAWDATNAYVKSDTAAATFHVRFFV